MAFGLSGLGAAYPGYLGAEEQATKIDFDKTKLRDAQIALMGRQAFGNALQSMFGGPAMAPPPPMPGQSSAAAPAPAGGPPGFPPGPGGPPPMGGPGMGAPPPMGGPGMAPRPPMGGGMPPGGPPSGGMGGTPGGGMMGMGGGPSLDWRVIIQNVARSNPGAPPEVIAAAVDQFVPMMNMESKLQWQELRNQFQMQLAEMKGRQAGALETQRQAGRERLHGMTGDQVERLARLGWDEDTIETAARTFNQTGKMPTNLGTRETAGFIVGAIQNRANALLSESGITPEQRAQDWQKYAGGTSYQRTAGTYGARVEAASNEAEQLAPQAIETSKALPRGEWVPVNRLIQKFEAGQSDPRYYEFAFANWSLLNAYARAINPTGIPRLEDKKHAAELLSTAIDQKSYEQVIKRMMLEIKASKEAISKTREAPPTGGRPLSSGKKTQDRVPPPSGPTNAPQTGTFDREAAKRAGYSDEEIDKYLSGK